VNHTRSKSLYCATSVAAARNSLKEDSTSLRLSGGASVTTHDSTLVVVEAKEKGKRSTDRDKEGPRYRPNMFTDEGSCHEFFPGGLWDSSTSASDSSDSSHDESDGLEQSRDAVIHGDPDERNASPEMTQREGGARCSLE
jgi:hypothetical protein